MFAERTDLSYPPVIETINVLEPNADFLAPGDKIHQIDGISTIGITNQQVLNILLCNREENAVIEIEYSLPEYCELLLKEILLELFLKIHLNFSITKQFVCDYQNIKYHRGKRKWVPRVNAERWRRSSADCYKYPSKWSSFQDRKDKTWGQSIES